MKSGLWLAVCVPLREERLVLRVATAAHVGRYSIDRVHISTVQRRLSAAIVGCTMEAGVILRVMARIA